MVNKIKFSLIIILGIVALYLTYNWFMRNTPEEQIRKVLSDLCYCASRSSDEKFPKMVMKNQNFGNYFAAESRIEFRAEMLNGYYTPQKLIAQVAKIRMYFKVLRVSIEDIDITMLSSEKARAYFTGYAKGITQSGYEVNEVRDLESILIYEDGAWKVSTLLSRKVLER